MSDRVIPIIDQRGLVVPLRTQSSDWHAGMPLLDTLHRPLRDLRISVTDRCNFRCSYCMPKAVFDKDYRYLPHASLLSFEEITRLARLFVARGVQKIRLTGGEPLLRKNIDLLIEQLAALRTPSGESLDITLTTNASLLAKKAQSLKDAGLKRVTVSLDALDDAVFRRMNDVDFPVADVLAGIEAAQAVGLGPIKINMVVKRGTNEQEILPMARFFKGSGMVLRFIEYMDVGHTNGWRMNEVLPSADVVSMIQAEMPMAQVEASAPGETAARWAYLDANGRPDPKLGEIGVISSVTQAFCSDCNRARLSTEGQLYLCLFASRGHDLRSLLRASADDAAITQVIGNIWHQRDDQYSLLRANSANATGAADASDKPSTSDSGARRVEMSYIGG